MDKTIASALVDRLLHHAHVIVTEGESVRLADATSGKGVNRPGFPGGSKPWEGWSHGRKETPLIEAVPA
jgi:hypothetical protein